MRTRFRSRASRIAGQASENVAKGTAKDIRSGARQEGDRVSCPEFEVQRPDTENHVVASELNGVKPFSRITAVARSRCSAST
jgi:hypothetical protein